MRSSVCLRLEQCCWPARSTKRGPAGLRIARWCCFVRQRHSFGGRVCCTGSGSPGYSLARQCLPLHRSTARRVIAGVPGVRWIALILSLAATTAVFFGERHALKLTPQQEQMAKEAGATFDEPQPPPSAESKTLDLITAKSTPKKSLLREYFDRVRDSGKWFSWLLWPVMRFFASGGKFVDWVETALGWPVLILLAAAVVQGGRRRQWIWPACGAYCAALCLNWPNPNARYLVPVAPLIIWGVVRGIELIGSGIHWQLFHRRAIIVFFASIFLCNGILYAVDLYVVPPAALLCPLRRRAGSKPDRCRRISQAQSLGCDDWLSARNTST